MTNAQMTAFRSTESASNDWRVYDAKGRCHMFGLSEERAREMAKAIQGGYAAPSAK